MTDPHAAVLDRFNFNQYAPRLQVKTQLKLTISLIPALDYVWDKDSKLRFCFLSIKVCKNKGKKLGLARSHYMCRDLQLRKNEAGMGLEPV